MFARLLIALLLIRAATAAHWETFNGNVGAVQLTANGTTFGGTFTRSTQFHWAADTRIGGRLARYDHISASGRVRLNANAGFDASIQLGHFETRGEVAYHTDFIGIRFMEHSAGNLRAQACIIFDRGAVRQGPILTLPAGEYDWSYEWIPNGLNGPGRLRASFVGPVSGVSEVTTGPEFAEYFFAANAFGLYSGFLPTSSTGTAEVIVRDATYRTIPLPPLSQKHIRVFLLIGQSNARGKDPSVGAFQYFVGPVGNVYLFGDEWNYAKSPTEPRNYYGPELSLGRHLADHLLEPVAIVKVTLGGRSLEDEWLPERGLSYTRLLDAIRTALPALNEPILSGLFSVQGEDDSRFEGPASRYSENLRRVHNSLRRDLSAPHLPLVISRLPSFIQYPYRDLVRSKQAEFNWIDTDDLTHTGDSLHYSAEGFNEIGRRLAASWRALAAQPVLWADSDELLVLTLPEQAIRIEESSDLIAWRTHELLTEGPSRPLPVGPAGARFFRIAP